MNQHESRFLDTRSAADYLGLSHRTLDGYRVRRGGARLPPLREPGALPSVGSGCVGGEPTSHHDGGGRQARIRMRVCKGIASEPGGNFSV